MAIFTVEYTYTDDDQGRDTHRAAHREYLGGYEGLLLSGPYKDFPAGALLVLEAEDQEAVESVLYQDPFQREGLIAERTVREYNPVMGSALASFARD